MQRRVAHLDMDAFYASVELLRYPQLRGLPVVIGGRHHGHVRTGDTRDFLRLRDYVGRGVVTTATYEARAFGVHSGTGIMKAARLAPDAILLPADFEQYRHYSHLFKAAVAEIAPAKLEPLGIHTVGDLAHTDPAMLVARFGPHYGTWLTDAAHGRDERPVVTHREPKSMSCETTFEHDLHPKRDRAALSDILLGLCQRVSGDLGRKGYLGKTIGIKLRYDDFRTVTRDVTLEEATADPETIRAAARTCLQRVALDRKLRLLGIRVASLRPSRYVGELSTAAVYPDGDRDVSHDLPLTAVDSQR